MTSSLFPYLSIRVAVREWETHDLAQVDTGFSGDLVIPEDSLPHGIGVPDYFRVYRVADDRVMPAPMFNGEIEIPGLPLVRDVAIGVIGSRYLIGLGVIERYMVTLVRGERVIVEE